MQEEDKVRSREEKARFGEMCGNFILVHEGAREYTPRN